MKKSICFKVLWSFCLLILPACQSPSVKNSSISGKSDVEGNLTMQEAELRNSVLSQVTYQLNIKLNGSDEQFQADATVQFELAKLSENVFLDFKNGAEIEKYSVNGQSVPPNYLNHRLALPASVLKLGSNQVQISYRQKYSQNGRGLHRFVDPEDRRPYFYTQFETFDAHHLLPCFDQPDVRATLKMTVTAPKDWQVITTTRETKTEMQGPMKQWSFPETPNLSSYVFSLHAGPYHKWESQAGKIPLRLFARQSLARYVNVNDWFTPTKQGLKFFGDYFQYPYPFKKYDQLIVPDFNAGAMENVAAVTFSERYVKRGPMTRQDREGIASVLLHEMAHMWFGDLVTMKWWNGLWLNESFATFMSSLAQNEATEFKESWISFYQGSKLSAYWQDQMVTTHSIESEIPDVAKAFTNFDAITYGKGASSLKQLRFYLGEKAFRDGVRLYFKKHAYSNTSLKDFIEALEQASGKDLSNWSQTWLTEAGLDSVQAVYSCDKNMISQFSLKATGPDEKTTPRTHKTKITLYREQGNKLSAYKSLQVEYKNDLTAIPQLKGLPCPAFVDPNDEDQDYVKVRFDQRSLATIQNHIAQLPAFTRLRVWPSLHQSVRDLEISPETYLKLAQTALPQEKDLKTIQQITQALMQELYYLKERTQWTKTFEKILWDRLLKSQGGSDEQKVFLQRYLEVAQSEESQIHFTHLLTGEESLPKFILDQDRRWALLVKLSALGSTSTSALLETEKQKDSSERGIQMVLAIDAAHPNIENKRRWFNNLISQEDLKYSRARAAVQSILPLWQLDLRASLADDYFRNLPQVSKKRSIEMAGLFTSTFVPALCQEGSANRLKQYIIDHPELPPTILKTLKNAQQEDARCVAIRAR